MPTVFRVGMSMNVYEDSQMRVLSTAEFSHPPDNSERANVGTEVGYKDFLYSDASWADFIITQQYGDEKAVVPDWGA